jgi:hypothetical protein
MKAMGVLVVLSLSLSACASTGWPNQVDASTVSDAPDHFLVLDTATGARSEPSGPACRSPMVDARDGTRLTLVRSSAGFGDYQTESSRYGLTGDRLLRIDCSNGRPVGLTAP